MARCFCVRASVKLSAWSYCQALRNAARKAGNKITEEFTLLSPATAKTLKPLPSLRIYYLSPPRSNSLALEFASVCDKETERSCGDNLSAHLFLCGCCLVLFIKARILAE